MLSIIFFIFSFALDGFSTYYVIKDYGCYDELREGDYNKEACASEGNSMIEASILKHGIQDVWIWEGMVYVHVMEFFKVFGAGAFMFLILFRKYNYKNIEVLILLTAIALLCLSINKVYAGVGNLELYYLLKAW